MRTFKVKAKLQFKDGINQGTFKVKAESEDHAFQVAVARLVDIWKIQASQILIIKITKG